MSNFKNVINKIMKKISTLANTGVLFVANYYKKVFAGMIAFVLLFGAFSKPMLA